MADKEKKLQVNVDFTPFPELYSQLEAMVGEDPEGDRSKFIRSLVRQEWGRRQQLAHPLSGAKKKTPAKQSSAVLA